MKWRSWIIFSGFVWFLIGSMLLYKGLIFLFEGFLEEGSYCSRWSNVFGSSKVVVNLFLFLGLSIGYLKGRFVLIKTVRRVVSRIVSLPMPIHFKDVYQLSYWLIIASMMGIGMLFRFLNLNLEVRGVIDIAIGSALIQGSILYFRAATYDKGSFSQSQ